jgi:hypothetical protein
VGEGGNVPLSSLLPVVGAGDEKLKSGGRGDVLLLLHVVTFGWGLGISN